MRCKRCDFRFECDTVRVKGVGAKNADIMLVLDMPSKSDDEYGVALSGDTAKKLKYLMKKAKVPLKRCYVTHALKCYSKAPPKKAHFEACEYWLLKEILRVKPKIIIIMGGKGLKILLGETATKDFRGHFWGIEIGDFKTTVMPTYGPNAALTKWEYDDYIVHDVRKAYKFSKDGLLPKKLKVDTTIVTDLKTLKEVEKECLSAKSLTFDLETTGLKFNQDEIVMVGFCPKPGRAIVIPYFVYDIKVHGKKWDQDNIHAAQEINKFVGTHKKQIRESLKRILTSDIKKTAHNGKFDEKFCRYNRFPVKKFTFDTIIAHALVDENKLHNLTFCLEWYGINHLSDDGYGPYEQDLWPYVNKDAKKKKPYSYAPPLLLASYLGKDVDGCHRLKPILLPKLKEENVFKLFKKQQMPLSRVMSDLEYTGIAMEVVGLQSIAKRFSEKLDGLERKMKNMTCNMKFNPRSSKQVVHYLQKLDAPLFKKTKGGGFSSDEAVLEQLARKPRKKWGKFSKYLLQHREITKLKGTYLDGSDGKSGILTHTDGKDIVHANWNIHTPRTGRMCLAKGTMIDVVRDLSKFPDGIPIEDVQIGDQVYCYDENKNLDIRKVLWSGKTGHKKVVRLHWIGQGRKSKGYVDLTPEHKVRLTSGDYVKAIDLKKNDAILSLSRSTFNKKYTRLHSRNMELNEHRFIFEKFNGNLCEHIHHVDGNTLNHLPNNLEGLLHSEHTSLHSKEIADGRREEFSKRAKQMWEDGTFKVRYGIENGRYRRYSKFSLLRELALCKGHLTKSDTIKDFTTFKNKCIEAGIDVDGVRKMYGCRGVYLSRGEVLNSFDLPYEERLEVLGVGNRKFKELCEYHNLKYSNHIVSHIEILNDKVDVYDLEVEGCHNFIANQLCVHNSCSDPNLQQIPRPNPKYPWANIRQLFYPRKKNWVMFSFDYKQLEMRIAAYLSRDYVMLDEIAHDVDMHTRNAVMFGTTLGFLPDDMTEKRFAKIRGYKAPENWEKRFNKSKRERIELKIHDAAVYDEHRTFSKSVGFGVNYGIMASTLAKDHDRDVDEVQEALDTYFRKYKKLALWREAMMLEWMEKGVLILPETNRKRRFYGASEWFNSKWSQSCSKREWDMSNVDRQAMNFPIQGYANEIYTTGKIKLYRAMKKERMKSRMMLSLHDGLLGEGPRDEMKELIPMAHEMMERILSEGKKYQVNLQIDCDIYEKWGGKKITL